MCESSATPCKELIFFCGWYLSTCLSRLLFVHQIVSVLSLLVLNKLTESVKSERVKSDHIPSVWKVITHQFTEQVSYFINGEMKPNWHPISSFFSFITKLPYAILQDGHRKTSEVKGASPQDEKETQGAVGGGEGRGGEEEMSVQRVWRW